jgi:hypothetical protein
MDPRNRGRSISPELLKQLAESKKNKKKDWHWSLTMTILGMIVGSILTACIMDFTMISYLFLLVAVLVIAVVSFVVQWRFFYNLDFIKRNFRLPIAIFALYNFGGVAIPTAGVLLTVNWIGASSTEDIEQIKIVGLDRSYVLDSQLGAPLLLENDAYKDQAWIRTFDYLKAIKWRKHPILEIVTHKGLFGIRVYYESRMGGNPLPEQNETTEQTIEPETDTVEKNHSIDSLMIDSLTKQLE